MAAILFCFCFFKIDVVRLKNKKVIIAHNNSFLIQHLFVAGTVLSALHLFSVQQHCAVDTIIFHILMISVRVVNSANVTQ